jgi:hypothetical protein
MVRILRVGKANKQELEELTSSEGRNSDIL